MWIIVYTTPLPTTTDLVLRLENSVIIIIIIIIQWIYSAPITTGPYVLYVILSCVGKVQVTSYVQVFYYASTV